MSDGFFSNAMKFDAIKLRQTTFAYNDIYHPTIQLRSKNQLIRLTAAIHRRMRS